MNNSSTALANVESELYYLIERFLAAGPCQRTATVLREEVEQHSLLPKRFDWTGRQHDNSFDDIQRLNQHIQSDHLIRILARIGPVLDKEIPPAVHGVASLLGAGRQSLLRTRNATINWSSVKQLAARLNQAPLYPSPQSLPHYPFSIVTSIISRENSGPTSARLSLPCKTYSRMIMYRRVLGHLSPIFCVAFDRTGHYVFTGADDSLVKIWSATNGRLLATLRGHMNEPIVDLAVNYENTLIASASSDKMIRVWCLKTSAPIAVLIGHNATVTSIKFCPLSRTETRYLVSTGNDGCICFWKWNATNNEFNPKPIKLIERSKPGNQFNCSTFSAGGIFLAVGSTDNYIRVYHVTAPAGPTKILEIEQHSDDVDSIQFSNWSTRFVSGSKDMAHIWYYERQNWHNIPLVVEQRTILTQDARKLKVLMVTWTCDDQFVITSLSDNSLRIWNGLNGKMIHSDLLGHEEEVFLIEVHPKDSRVFISGGYDGRIIIWDAITGTAIKKFFNVIDGQGSAAIHDFRFSPDGLTFAATDSLGHLSLYGFGSNEVYQKVPDQLFFHTDYRPLVRDANQYVIDEQTQTAPHLMPPPFLVDIDGNPYPPHYQRLVPGRENCTDQALVPYIAVHNENGVAEVLQPVVQEQPGPSGQDGGSRRTIDDMIERLAQEQNRMNPHQAQQHHQQQQQQQHHDVMQEHDYVAPPTPQVRAAAAFDQNRSPRSGRVMPAHRGRAQSTSQQPVVGQHLGVRQSANWRSRDAGSMKSAWSKRLIVAPLNEFELEKVYRRAEQFAEAEEAHFNVERKKRPLINDITVSLRDAIKQERFTRRKRRIIQQRHGVERGSVNRRVNRRPESRYRNGIIDFENPEDLISDDSDSDFVGSGAEEWKDSSSGSSDSSESENSEDSDWDTGTTRRRRNSNNNNGNGERTSRRSSNESAADDDKENEDEEDLTRPSTSRNTASSSRRKTDNPKLQEQQKKLEMKFKQFKELPPEFRLPEWLTETVPRKFPYYPQVGDEVVYFRQGHQLYLDAVREKKAYTLNQSLKPYKIRKAPSDEVFCSVTDIKYDVKPPRLVILKLMVLNHDDNSPTGEYFTVKYHDMADVIDFFVLRQIYDNSLDRNWSIGDEFRAIIDEKWWFGKIIDHQENDQRFPQSHFQCFKAQWASGDSEQLSPWDMEPIDEQRPPANRKDSLSITGEERLAFYRPKDEEWPPCGRDDECRRIAQGLAKIMEMGHAEIFASPVDLDTLPVYGMTIPYPIDLSTIKSRVENRFYRRIDAIKFDVEYIENNARQYNEAGSEIVKKAKIITTLCKQFIDDCSCSDPMGIYLRLVEHHADFDEPVEFEDDVHNDSDFEPPRRNPLRSKRKHDTSSDEEQSRRSPKKRSKRDRIQLTSKTWKKQCRELLNTIIQDENSSPFRSPVDPIQYPNYLQLIDTPMDLTTVKEQLLADLYENPNEFCKDMRLIFQNSKTYNTNKKSRIYNMTVNLQTKFEQDMRHVISDWRSAVAYEKKLKSNKLVSKRRVPVSQFSNNQSQDSGRSGKSKKSSKNKSKSAKPSPPTTTVNRRRANQRQRSSSNRRGPSSSASLSSPTFDQPSTSGYRTSNNRSKRVLKPTQASDDIRQRLIKTAAKRRRNNNWNSSRNKRRKTANRNNNRSNNNNTANTRAIRMASSSSRRLPRSSSRPRNAAKQRISNGDIESSAAGSLRRHSTRQRKPVKRFYGEDDEDDQEEDVKPELNHHHHHDEDDDDDPVDDIELVVKQELQESTASSVDDFENHMDSETEIEDQLEDEEEEEEEDQSDDEDGSPYDNRIRPTRTAAARSRRSTEMNHHQDSDTEIDDDDDEEAGRDDDDYSARLSVDEEEESDQSFAGSSSTEIDD